MASEVPAAVLEWLLEANNQPVRYLTLSHLLDRPQSDRDVQDAAAACAGYAPTRKILSQFKEYRSHTPAEAYRKYTGRYWQIIFLGQYLADGKDRRVRELAERLIERKDWLLFPRGGQCLSANLLSALALLGYGGDPAVKTAVTGLAERFLADGGIACEGMDYSLLPRCYMAQPKLLLCFAGNAECRGNPSVTAAVERICRNLSEHGIYNYVPGNKAEWLEVLARKPDKSKLRGGTVKRWVQDQREAFLDRHGTGKPKAKAGWLKPGFPLNYNSDVLEALYAIALSGVPADDGLTQPLDLLRGKLNAEGRVVLESGLNGKMRADAETVGKPSKWLTYRAWYVLRRLG